MEILIDTNFIISCVSKKIDLFEELKRLFGIFVLVVPTQVIKELEKISKDKLSKRNDREFALISLKILNLTKYKKLTLETKDADSGIIRYAVKNKNVIIATLDRNLKKRIRTKNKNIKFILIKQKNLDILNEDN